MITASHNPPNHNGVKSSTWYGGVDTDDISDRIAHVRLSRPDELNTMTKDFWRELPEIVTTYPGAR